MSGAHPEELVRVPMLLQRWRDVVFVHLPCDPELDPAPPVTAPVDDVAAQPLEAVGRDVLAGHACVVVVQARLEALDGRPGQVVLASSVGRLHSRHRHHEASCPRGRGAGRGK